MKSKKLKPKARPLLLSEFGGFSFPVKGHLSTDKSYGYGACSSPRELTERIIKTYERMVIPAIGSGLCGCIYTQVSDVEDEINGLFTYDREVLKVDPERILMLSKKLKIR